MKREHHSHVNDILDTASLSERYDDAAEEPRERTASNIMLALLGILLALALLWAIPAGADDCPAPAAASWLEARGYAQVELEPLADGWWRSWWMRPDGSVRLAVLQPLGDGSGCHAWHLPPAETATIEKLRLANEDDHR